MDLIESKATVSAEARDLLAVSGLLDEARYRLAANLPENIDAATHYLTEGWVHGLEPRDDFDGSFLRPYYESAGRYGPPALTWLELSIMPGRRPPTNAMEAVWLADRVRQSQFFESESYARRLGPHLDPATHYAVIGELLGWMPSQAFDPYFYLNRYVDIAQHNVSPLEHYIFNGFREGRRAIPAANRLLFPKLLSEGRPAIILLVHDSSRTGAPVLGWNIAQRLASSYDVVSVIMRGGELDEQFAAVSAAIVGPLTWEEWHAAEMEPIAERLVTTYKPIYSIANSIETNLLVPALAKLGVPSVALVHEFAAYTRPLAKMRGVLDWATHVVFPSNVVAESTYKFFPAFATRRGVHVLSQGPSNLPPRHSSTSVATRVELDSAIGRSVRPPEAANAFVVLGLGAVQIRKGVDLFLATAASARRLAPEIDFRFVWIGDGYSPEHDAGYSAYLAEQLARSDISQTVIMLDAIENLDPAYASADVFFMCSRLDPQPNVGIDAVTRGLPTVCFERASGTAEILNADLATTSLVVPYLDTHAAAEAISRLAREPQTLFALRGETARVGKAAFDMESYVEKVDAWGRESAAALHQEDLRNLIDGRAVDVALALPLGAIPSGTFGAERHVLQQWAVVGTSQDQVSNPEFRRPCAGFHPQVYAKAHPAECFEGGAHPLAHWLRAGRPVGQWSRQVFSPLDVPVRSTAIRLALHVHFYYVQNAPDLARRLAVNEISCDLFVSTDTEIKAALIRSAFAKHRGALEVRIMPNRGRDIGPFLTGFAREIQSGDYDIFGHIHAKQSVSIDETMGNSWREFLWDNLIGGSHPMMDLVAAAFSTHSDLGVLMAEDPHLVGWDDNRVQASAIAARMGLAIALDDFFDFPLGNMFWARPSVLQPMLDLGLTWADYPTEPLANDGTILHALERLLPYTAQHVGLRIGGLRAPDTTW